MSRTTSTQQLPVTGMGTNSLSEMQKDCSFNIALLGHFRNNVFTILSQGVKYSWRKITNEAPFLLIPPWKFKHGNWVLKSRGCFIHLTDTALSVDRLITTQLSTYSSKWKFHEYLAVVAYVSRGWQRDLKHIMYKFLISDYKLFSFYWYELKKFSCFYPFV